MKVEFHPNMSYFNYEVILEYSIILEDTLDDKKIVIGQVKGEFWLK